jgi:hypothetical protein
VNRFTRRLAPAAALLLAGSTLAGCAFLRPPALTIARDSSSEPFFSLSADDLFAELGKTDPAGGTNTTKPAFIDADRIAELLTGKVRPKVLSQVLADRRIVATDADKQLAQQAAEMQQSQPSPDEIEFQGELAALARVLQTDFFSRPGNDVNEYARRYYDQRRTSFAQQAQTCLHVLTVDAGDGQNRPSEDQYTQTLPKAQALRTRLDSEPWEKVFEATGASAQGLPGGDLGCRADQNLPEEVVEAIRPVAKGTISAPLRWRVGWLIVRIDDRKEARTPPFEEVREDAAAAARQTLGQQLATEVLTRAYAAFVVTVDPRFGRWSAEQAQVLRPDGSAVPTIPTTTTTLPPLDEGPGATPPGSAPEGSVPPGSSPPPAAPPATTATTRAG